MHAHIQFNITAKKVVVRTGVCGLLATRVYVTQLLEFKGFIDYISDCIAIATLVQ